MTAHVSSDLLHSVFYTLFLNKNVVFSGQAEYSYFSADFSLKIFVHYSLIIVEKERIYHILLAVCSLFSCIL